MRRKSFSSLLYISVETPLSNWLFSVYRIWASLYQLWFLPIKNMHCGMYSVWIFWGLLVFLGGRVVVVWLFIILFCVPLLDTVLCLIKIWLLKSLNNNSKKKLSKKLLADSTLCYVYRVRINVLTLGLYEARGAPEVAALVARGSLLLVVD